MSAEASGARISEGRWEGAAGTLSRLGGLQLDTEGGGRSERSTGIGPRRAGRVVSTMGLWPGTVSEVPGLFVPEQEIWVHTFPLGIESPHGHDGALESPGSSSHNAPYVGWRMS